MPRAGAVPDVDGDLDGLEVDPSGRRGAHRQRRSPGATLIPLLLVLVAVTGIVVGVWALVGANGRDLPGLVEAPASAASPTSEDTGGDTGGDTPEVADTATASGTPSPPLETGPPIDREAPVTVLNSTGTSGLAAGASDVLDEAGWTVASLGNYPASSAPSAVYFADPAQSATAAALADDLGGIDVQQSGVFAARGLTVLLGPDYVP